MPRSRVGAPAVSENDDTDGNRFHGIVKDGVEDDTDGQSVRTGHVADGVEDEDTDGNRFHGIVKDGVEDDDSEGNSACVKH